MQRVKLASLLNSPPYAPQRSTVSMWLGDSDTDDYVDHSVADGNELAITSNFKQCEVVHISDSHTHSFTSCQYTNTNKCL